MIWLLVKAFLVTLKIYYYLLFAYALMSWVPPVANSLVGRFLAHLVEPVLKPLRRLNLQFAGLDFTVWVGMVGLQLLTQFLLLILVN